MPDVFLPCLNKDDDDDDDDDDEYFHSWFEFRGLSVLALIGVISQPVMRIGSKGTSD